MLNCFIVDNFSSSYQAVIKSSSSPQKNNANLKRPASRGEKEMTEQTISKCVAFEENSPNYYYHNYIKTSYESFISLTQGEN